MSLKWKSLITFIALSVSALLASSLWSDSTERTPNSLDYSQYFLADIRDAEYCDLKVSEDGKSISFGKNVTNPAMTCPDAFSWKLFTDVVNARFWSDWASETDNWPEDPWPLCTGGNKKNCCSPGTRVTGTPAEGHCPVYPGDEHKADLKLLDKAKDDQAIQTLFKKNSKLIRKSFPSILESGASAALQGHGKKMRLSASASDSIANCTPEQIKNFKFPENPESIGRLIRQTNAELTVRNRPFHEYLYHNDLYNADGVMNVFRKNKKNQSENAPYHLRNVSAGKYGSEEKVTPPGEQQLSRIDLPPDAIMIKSNWLHHDLAKKIGIPTTEGFITSQQMETQLCLAKDKTPESCSDKAKDYPANFCNLTGEHYLMAFHISSKDVPQWVWTTFEHVSNPSRCDFIGCNDSFGYASQPAAGASPDSADNFLVVLDGGKINQRSDELNSPSIVNNLDKYYALETIRPALDNLFKKTGIGMKDGKSDNTADPDPHDSAWRNYRLKGSQVNFTDHEGRSTKLGNSITEAGFMTGSSCISCHSRAGVHIALELNEKTEEYEEKANFFHLSVFNKVISQFGYAQSVHNVPDPNWFHNSDEVGTLDVLQTDFIWGFLFAQPLSSGDSDAK
ncbi:hypothetical protein [Endozoicomonas montiporae]|uniref:Cytochrome c family protein n=1 Tax=Endozoicomonas montiporae CL-33 TaxID=570277 RepID=A0A142B7E9_9GAMM|nr:hypothetical protein [Endozoicomonas montiporae]AMO54675.1 hypothetical protein EZMO1_0424 [Endozoicomonas montiporae CL-33]